MEKIILPIELSPPLKCHLWQLHFLGIIFGQKKEAAFPWLFNHYYQLRVNTNHRHSFIEWDEKDPAFLKEEVLLQKNFSVRRDAIDTDIAFGIIRNMMKIGFYCVGNINEKYIPGLNPYKKRDTAHQFLLYGIDEEQHIVNTYTYVSDGRIKPFTIKYSDLFDAMMYQTTYAKNDIFLSFYRLNDDFSFDCFNPQNFLQGIETYLTWESGKGIRCIHQWVDWIEIISTEQYIDLRDTLVFKEKALLMLSRLKYMFQSGYLSNKQAIERYKKISDTTQIIHLLSIKYNKAHEQSILDEIVRTMRPMLEEEEIVLKMLYSDCAHSIAR